MSEATPAAVGFIDQSGGKATYEIDFTALRNKASEMLDASEATPTPDPVPAAKPAEADPSVTRVKGASDGQGSAAKPTETPVEAPAAKQDEVVKTDEATPKELSVLTDDALVSVPVDGEDQVMTWKEAKAGFSRTAKFTKSMQALAKDREAVEASQRETDTLRNERAGLENFLRNPNAILNYVVREFGPNALQVLTGQPQQAQPARNPDEIVTAGEAQQIAALERQAVEAQIQNVVKGVEQRIAEATQSIEAKQQQAQHAVAISSTLHDIFTTNPVLKSIPNAEDLIRYEVAQMRPKTEAEALEAFKNVAQGIVEDVGKHFKAQQKITKVAEVKAKLESKSIEPPGGSAPQLQPTNYKNADGSVNWNSVRDMALSYGA